MPLTDSELEALRAASRKRTTPPPQTSKPNVPSPAIRGARTSSTGILAGQGPTPEEEIAWAIASSEEGFWDQLTAAAVNLAGGAPAFAGGALAGGAAGGAAGSAVPVLGTAAGTALGAGAGAFAADGAIKGAWRGYNELRRDPKYKDMSFGEVLEGVASGSIKEASKSGAIGFLTAAVPYAGLISKTGMWTATANSRAGQLFTLATKGSFSTPMGKKALEFAGELGVLTVAPAAFEGSWPGWQDVAVNATLLGAFKAAFRGKPVGDKLKELAERGKTIDDVMSSLTPEELASLEKMPKAEFDTTLREYIDRELKRADAIEREAQISAKELDIAEGIKRTSEEKLQPERIEKQEQAKAEKRTKTAEETFQEDKKAAEAREREAVQKAEAKANEPVNLDEKVQLSPEYREYARPILKRLDDIASSIKRTRFGEKGEKAEVKKLGELTGEIRKLTQQIKKQPSNKKLIEQLKALEADKKRLKREIESNRKLRAEQSKLNTQLEQIRQPIRERLKKEAPKPSKSSAVTSLRQQLRPARNDVRESQAKPPVEQAPNLKLEQAKKEAAETKRDALIKAQESLNKRQASAEQSRIDTTASRKQTVKEKASVERPAREKSLAERKDKLLTKAKEKADKIRKQAKDFEEVARKDKYFEIDARKLDPNAPKDKKVRRRIVEKTEADKGKSNSEILRSRLVQQNKRTITEFGQDLLNSAKGFKTGVFDKLKPLEKFVENPEKFFENPKKLAEWIDSAESTMRYMLEHNQIDFLTHADLEGTSLIKNLEKIFGGKKPNYMELQEVMLAFSSLDRQNLGQRNPVPTQVALERIGKKDRYVLAAREIQRFIDTQLQRAIDAGIVSPEGAKAMRDMYQNYFPLFRLMGAGEQQFLSQSGLLPGNVIKAAKGSERLIYPPLESFFKNMLAQERTIRKNEAMKALGKMLKRMGFGMKEVTEPDLMKANLDPIFGKEVVDTFTKDDLAGIKIFKNSTDIGPKDDGYIYFYEKGKRIQVEAPKEIHDLVRNVNAREMGAIERGLNSWRNFFSRAVVTFPKTALKIGVLDPLVGFMQTKNGRLAYLKELFSSGYPASLFKTAGSEQLMKDYVKFGGARHSLFGANRRGDWAGLGKTVTQAAKDGDSGVKTLIKAPIQAAKASFAILESLATKVADAPRLAEFKLSQEKYKALGWSEAEANFQAAYDAWEVTVPYGREGAWKAIQLLNRIIPFSRTILASNEAFLKAVDPRTASGRATLMAGTAALTLPTLYFYLANRNHPAFLAEDEQTKNENILIYPSLFTGNVDPYEKPIKIPHLWQYGWLFQKLPESVLEYALNNDPDSVRNLLRDFEYNYSPATFLSLSEGLIAAQKSGHVKPEAFFQGRFGAAPKRYKTLEPEAQVNANTSETAKWLSENVPFAPSPIWIDQMVNKIGAGFGDLAMRLGDEALIGLGAAEDRKPEENLIAQHLFGAFIGKGPKKYSAHLKKFYELTDSQRAKYNTYKEYEKVDPVKARNYAANTKWVSNKVINSMYSGIREYAQRIARVEYRASHNAAEKAAKSRELMNLYIEMGKLAERYNKMLEDQIRVLNG